MVVTMAANLTGPIPIASPLSSSLTDDDYPLIGETLGLWRLIRGIGRGGMGEVYEAEYDFIHLLTLQVPVHERPLVRQELADLPRSEQATLASDMLGNQMGEMDRFAIKVCTARVGTAAHKRFLQEAEWAKKLGSHPYIVSVHNIHAGNAGESEEDVSKLPINKGPHSDVAYMVMDLAARRYNVAKSSIKDAVHVVRCVAAALDHAHSAGIIHRDLKPENILGDEHHPLLTDFGIAKEVDQGLGLTRTGQIIGTLDYMSPEQATDAKHVDLRTDVYSLGVVLYEFATGGCLPYYHLTDRESCLAGIRSERTEPRWPRQYVPGFPRSLEWIILRAMAHRPEERYQSMSDFIADLDRYSRGAWIPFIGRVHPRRLFNYAKKSHPYWLYGIPAAIVLTLVVWFGIWLANVNNADLNALKEGMKRLNAAEIMITNPPKKQQMLDKEEVAIVEKLRRILAENPDSYNSYRDDFVETIENINRNRFLRVVFEGKYLDSSRERLEVATGKGDNWSTVEIAGRPGLQINANERWNLRPYGTGHIYTYFSGTVLPGFRMEVSEHDQPSHRLWIEYQNSKITAYFREDEKQTQILDVKRVPADGFLMRCGLFASEDELLFIWPGGNKHFNQIGLNSGSPAQITFEVPKGVVVEQMYIGGKRPR